MVSGLYTPEILRLATTVPHLGQLAAPTGQDSRRSPLCGSRISVDVVLDPEGRVVDFAQQVNACALGQASASLLGQHIIGRRREDIAKTATALRAWLVGTAEQVPDWPGLDVFAAARAHSARHDAICLPFEAVAAAAAQAVVP